MFLRFLGRFFLYFYVFPVIASTFRSIIAPAMKAGLIKVIADDRKKQEKERARSRQDHPAGSRQS